MPRPLRLLCDASGRPKLLYWHGGRYPVASILERWKDAGRWWAGESPKLFFRLRTVDGALWEIYRDGDAPGAWYLYRLYD
ncbi:MAG: DUF6504 family protein [Bacillota bacterium]|nr:DUF6504 family protein [Bacillota bacterium]